jgi:hypothetical protein
MILEILNYLKIILFLTKIYFYEILRINLTVQIFFSLFK